MSDNYTAYAIYKKSESGDGTWIKETTKESKIKRLNLASELPGTKLKNCLPLRK